MRDAGAASGAWVKRFRLDHFNADVCQYDRLYKRACPFFVCGGQRLS